MIAGCVSKPLLALLSWEWGEYREALLQQGTATSPTANNTLPFLAQMEGQAPCHLNRHRATSGGSGISGNRHGSEMGGGMRRKRVRRRAGAEAHDGGPVGEDGGGAGGDRSQRRVKRQMHGGGGQRAEGGGGDSLGDGDRRRLQEWEDEEGAEEAGEAEGGARLQGGRRSRGGRIAHHPGGGGAAPYVWEADAQELLTHLLHRYEHQQVVGLRGRS